MKYIRARALLLCAGIATCAPVWAQVDDMPLKRSDIGKGGGVAGLDATRRVTNDVSNNTVVSRHIEFPDHNQEIVFNTGSPDSNNRQIHIGYDLDKKKVYFTNDHYGNIYDFNGTIKTSSLRADDVVPSRLLLENPGNSVVFNTNSLDSNNPYVRIGWDPTKNALVFTNDRYGNEFRFEGNVNARGINAEGMKPGLVEFDKPGKEIVFDTLSLDTNNQKVHIGYDLASNSVYFTNQRYGNNYSFNGPVRASDFVLNGGRLLDAGYFAADAFSKGAPDNDRSRLWMSNGADWGNLHPDTLMLGGARDGQYMHIKATCTNTSGGDEGGSCYQFTDMRGPQNFHRGGAGNTDGINIDARSQGNGPLDMLGGNELITNADGTHRVGGSLHETLALAKAGQSFINMTEVTTCGPNLTCLASGAKFRTKDGTLVDEAPVIAEDVPIFAADGKTQIGVDHRVTLSSGYSLASDLAAHATLTLKVVSRDGKAYAYRFRNAHEVVVYPKLSDEEAAVFRGRMSMFTNIVNGMASTEKGGNTDYPNYYYGYFAGLDTSTGDDGTGIYVEASFYPGTSSARAGFVTLAHPDVDRFGVTGQPGTNKGDQIDFSGISYTGPDGKVYQSTQTHRYRYPALFFGMSTKNFNSYSLQQYTRPVDGLTRAFDNEWDFWMTGTHPGETSSRGLTMTWGGSTLPLSPDSWMLNLAGNNVMPVGLDVNGVFPYGGRLIRSDAAFNVFRNRDGNAPGNVGDTQSVISLGQGIMGSEFRDSYAVSAAAERGATHLVVKGVIAGYLRASPAALQMTSSNAAIQAALPQGTNTITAINVDERAGVTQIDLAQPLAAAISANGATISFALPSKFVALHGYVSRDGQENPSYHLGALESGDDLEYVARPDCSDASKISCHQAGQLVFDPAGIPSGIGLGVGKGSEMDYSLVARAKGNVVITHGLELGSARGGQNPRLVGQGADTVQFLAASGEPARLNVGTLIQKLETPASSSAACSPGQTQDDSNYHYVCVASNRWKRVALSDF
ncbi:hypothetical protein C0V97_02285 [Asaia sp. W19]|uniref:hypothetical protein n=1 Tax=unclassified Asaia TaxID=2685023 RepID=UPI000F8C4D94|nr:hypothetical protein [Asaia sp. W19]RUT27071.1 hypothetical protein C0V97_02285 [Asaia sp. W19]